MPPKPVLGNALMDPKEWGQCFSQRKTREGVWEKNIHKLREVRILQWFLIPQK